MQDATFFLIFSRAFSLSRPLGSIRSLIVVLVYWSTGHYGLFLQIQPSLLEFLFNFIIDGYLLVYVRHSAS